MLAETILTRHFGTQCETCVQGLVRFGQLPAQCAACGADRRGRVRGCAKTPEAEASRRLAIGQKNRARWAKMSREDRRVFGRRVSAGHARRRARGEGYKPHALWRRKGAN